MNPYEEAQKTNKQLETIINDLKQAISKLWPIQKLGQFIAFLDRNLIKTKPGQWLGRDR